MTYYIPTPVQYLAFLGRRLLLAKIEGNDHICKGIERNTLEFENAVNKQTKYHEERQG